jgi:RHS repeat-associated protein
MNRFIILFSLWALCAANVSAQASSSDLQGGMTPYGTFQNGDVDSISLGSGNVSVHIPLVLFPQRGGKIRLAFNYYDTNKNWYIYKNGSQSTWTFVGSTQPGGPYVSPDQRITAHGSIIKWQDGNGLNWNIKLTNAITADGASHEILYPDPRSAHGVNAGYSSDATGIYYSNPNFFDNLGNEYTAPPLATGPGNVIDSNGNEVTYGSNGWTDTIGRIIPGYPTSGTMTTAPGVSGATTNCPTGTVSALQWNVPTFNGATAVYRFCYANFSWQTAFGYPGVNESHGTALMISAIVLPNLTKWVFNYDAYLSISSITLPTGGTVSYTWRTSLTGESRIIASRTVNANDGTGAHAWNYQWSGNNNLATLIVTDPLSNDAVYTITNGYVTQAQYYTGSHTSGTLLKTASTQYSPWTEDPMGLYIPGDDAFANVVPLIETVAWPSGQTMQSTTTYDPGFQYGVFDSSGVLDTYHAYYGVPVLQTTSDYGQGSAGSILSQKSAIYYWQNNSSYLTANLLTLPQTIKFEDSSGNSCSETDYTYDNATYLTSSGISVQHISPPSSVRGNLSTVTNQLASSSSPCQANPSWTPITSYVNAYDTGGTYKSIDPLGHTITYTYSTTFAGAYPTIISNALSQNTTNNFDFNTGVEVTTTDANLLQTTFLYDNMSRLIQQNNPDGGQISISRQETTTPFSWTTTKKINASQNLVTMDIVDGLGRIYRHELTSDPQGTIYTDSTYDALGRVSTVSNPYRSGTDITTSAGTVTYGYDALGRKITETYPDSSILTTAYCGPSTLVTDPVGKWRRSKIDGLGRMVEVDEPNAINATVASTGCPGTNEPIWVTAYTFDNLGNITNVIQNGSHQRTFTYDSLSRMLTSTNPEVGAITYAYNNDSVLISKTDARAITVNYNPAASPIDALHRVTEITYSNGDPTVTYAYDQTACQGLSTCQNIGHRTGMTDAAGSEAWAYLVDRTNSRTIRADNRTTNSIVKTSTYYFNLAGDQTQLVYPTGRTINYTYDSADRPSTAVDGSNGITYAAGFKTSPGGTCIVNTTCYTPQGSIYAFSIGQTSSFTGVNVTNTYNSRLEALELKASSTGGNAIDITYSFVDPATLKNAGHVYSITNNLNSNRTQSFTYDQVNRILSAGTSVTTGSLCWGYKYTYDAWGNLTSQGGWTPTYSACTEGIMNPVTVDGNNHISGFTYDLSGDATNDGLYSYTWNGESQLKSAAGISYTYDGDGRRVAKVGSKLYWYGANNELLAETNPSGAIINEYVYFRGKTIALLPSGSTAQFYIGDTLGTSRIVTTNTGVVCYDADFTPFGGERSVTSSCAQNNYKFEGKERDVETGNDDFDARSYNNRFGRFLSADWSAYPEPVPYADLTNPQTLNLYSMVQNDPESFTDLDGHEAEPDPDPQQPKPAGQCISLWCKLKIWLGGNGSDNSPPESIGAGPSLRPSGTPTSHSTKQNAAKAAAIPLVVCNVLEPCGAIADTVIGIALVSAGAYLIWDNLHQQYQKAPAYPPDPTKAPGPDWVWRGKGAPGSKDGSWYNPKTGESLHPDLQHPDPIGPHWDYRDPNKNDWRIFPDGRVEPK